MSELVGAHRVSNRFPTFRQRPKGGQRTIVFAGLKVDADAKSARALAESMGWNWGQTYLGSDSDMAHQLAISSLLAYYLIGPDGRLSRRGANGVQ